MKALKVIQNKIIKDNATLKRILQLWKFKEQKIVFTNGCFDIIHRGHIDYLSKAKDLGNKLVVGINSDSSVRSLNKGSNRPIQDESSRTLLMASLHFVDLVLTFEESTPIELIKIVQPDVLVKGSDYAIHEVVGHEIVQKYGEVVKTIDYLEGYSTTAIVNKACQ